MLTRKTPTILIVIAISIALIVALRQPIAEMRTKRFVLSAVNRIEAQWPVSTNEQLIGRDLNEAEVSYACELALADSEQFVIRQNALRLLAIDDRRTRRVSLQEALVGLVGNASPTFRPDRDALICEALGLLRSHDSDLTREVARNLMGQLAHSRVVTICAIEFLVALRSKEAIGVLLDEWHTLVDEEIRQHLLYLVECEYNVKFRDADAESQFIEWMESYGGGKGSGRKESEKGTGVGKGDRSNYEGKRR